MSKPSNEFLHLHQGRTDSGGLQLVAAEAKIGRVPPEGVALLQQGPQRPAELPRPEVIAGIERSAVQDRAPTLLLRER